MLVQPCPVGHLEVGRAATYERMVSAEIVAERDAQHAPGEIGCAVAHLDQVADDGLDRAGAPARSHEPDLSTGPIEDLRAYRMALARIAVEQARGCIATNRGGELPTEVHRVTEPEVEALAA